MNNYLQELFINEAKSALKRHSGGSGAAHTYILEEVGSDTLTWDGNTEGLEYCDTFGDGTMLFYRVSEKTPMIEDFANGISCVVNGETVEITDIGSIDNIITSSSNMSFIVATNDNVVFMDGVLPKKGIYVFYLDANTYVSSLTINGYTGFVTTKIKESALPDSVTKLKESIVDEQKTVLIDNQTFSYSADETFYPLPSDCILTDGNFYRVKINGTEYECIAETSYSDGLPTVVVTDGETFMIGCIPLYEMVMLVMLDGTTDDLTITLIEDNSKIKENLLPEVEKIVYYVGTHPTNTDDTYNYLFKTTDTSDVNNLVQPSEFLEAISKNDVYVREDSTVGSNPIRSFKRCVSYMSMDSNITELVGVSIQVYAVFCELGIGGTSHEFIYARTAEID